MSETPTQTRPSSSSTAEASKPTAPSKEVAKKGDSVLVTDQGTTTIADTVVAKIAGIAAREVTGVHALGGGAARAVGALRERIGGSAPHSQGVSVEVGEREAAVDLQLVAEYGVSIADLSQSIRRNVISSIEGMTGLQVTEVNIEVQDVYLESEDSSEKDKDDPQPPRVQ